MHTQTLTGGAADALLWINHCWNIPRVTVEFRLQSVLKALAVSGSKVGIVHKEITKIDLMDLMRRDGTRSYDAVIGADGCGSITASTFFKDEVRLHILIYFKYEFSHRA